MPKDPEAEPSFVATPLPPRIVFARSVVVPPVIKRPVEAVVLEHVVHGDDVGVVQLGDGDRLAPEPFGDHGIGGEVRLEPFDGNSAIELGVGRHPYLGHPAVPDPPLEAISAREQLDGRIGNGRRR